MSVWDPSMVQASYAGNAAQDGDTFDPTGKYSIKKQGAFACVECAVSEGDEVMSEGGAMVAMSNNVKLDVSKGPPCNFKRRASSHHRASAHPSHTVLVLTADQILLRD